MSLRYPCLILDHDDTTVDSTATIHYPAYQEAMRVLRPGYQVLTLDDFFRKHIDPGFFPYLRDELKLNPEEMKLEFNIWQEFARERVPLFYPEMLAFLQRYREYGGIISVVSHSEVEMIERDYRANDAGFVPDLIFGWHETESKRKPDPYPILETMKQFHFQPEQILSVDDLKWGIMMGQAAGVTTVAAGWGHRVPEVVSYMQEISDYYLETVRELREFVIKD